MVSIFDAKYIFSFANQFQRHMHVCLANKFPLKGINSGPCPPDADEG